MELSGLCKAPALINKKSQVSIIHIDTDKLKHCKMYTGDANNVHYLATMACQGVRYMRR